MLVSSLVICLGALVLLVLYQQFRIYQIHRYSEQREELFQIVTENAADMIALVDVKGRRLYNSPSYRRILGYSPAELSETSAFEQIHPDDRFKVLAAAREARETGEGRCLEYRIRHKDGTWRVLESLASTIRDRNGRVAKLVIVNRDITARKQAEEELEHNRLHDPLTGLPNRALFLDRLRQLFVRTERDSAHCYALLLANVDHFKVFNERLGMAGGDQLLREIAHRLGACLRKEDTISRRASTNYSSETMLSRMGGDEFSVLLDGVGDPGDAMRIVKRIQAVIAEPIRIDAQEVRLSLSVGIAMSVPEQAEPEQLLKDADAAMRRAKRLGGSRCEIFDEIMHLRAESRMRLEADLRTAIAQRQFRIHYQPIVQLNTRRVVSLEALLRWDHSTHGLISPYEFLEAAQDTGLLVSIGHWLILQACRQLREWEVKDASVQTVNITANVSARQFADARLTNDLKDALRETGISPARLQLEIPESVAAADPQLTITILSHLKHLGIGMILDDFGVGTASLRGLRQFSVDALKIHRSLITEMQSDRATADMVEVFITLAHKLNMKVIAEGIETARQLDHLSNLGCEFGQGSYFSPPLEAKAVPQLLRQQGTAMRKSGTVTIS